MNKHITAGELAKLAGTTKRTILWYDKLGIIKPVLVSDRGYRYYLETQVLEYQMTLLLITLGVTLKEIGDHLVNKGDLKSLFEIKKKSIKNQIDGLWFSLNNLERFMKNIDETKTMVKPEIKVLKPMDIFYIERVGPYVEIGKYCQELMNMFDKKGKKVVNIAIFENPTYQPRRSPIKIGVIATSEMIINSKYREIVKRMKFEPKKVITYTHNGAGRLLSLFWKELEKYCRLNKIEVRRDVADFEIYRKINTDPKKQFMEIYLPIK